MNNNVTIKQKELPEVLIADAFLRKTRVIRLRMDELQSEHFHRS